MKLIKYFKKSIHRGAKKNLLKLISNGKFRADDVGEIWSGSKLEALRILLEKGDFESKEELVQAVNVAGKISSKSKLEALKILLEKGDFESKEELVQAANAVEKILSESNLEALKILLEKRDFGFKEE